MSLLMPKPGELVRRAPVIWRIAQCKLKDRYSELEAQARSHYSNVIGMMFFNDITALARKNLGLDSDSESRGPLPFYGANEAMAHEASVAALSAEAQAQIRSMFETIDKVGIEGADDAALIATLKETLASAVEGVTANARGAYGVPLLVHGAYSCDEAVLTTLLEAGADPSAESSMDGETAWSVVTDTCPQFLPLLERFGGHLTPSAEERGRRHRRESPARGQPHPRVPRDERAEASGPCRIRCQIRRSERAAPRAANDDRRGGVRRV
eukprot:m.293893 g.293893  ORF g.293893 m.293893 type:complete len:268 (-) comp27148_c0_seq2:712-1515(-)